MSIYTYSQSKVIDEVAFKKTANGAIRAYIHACPENITDVDPILDKLQAAGFKAVPFVLNDKPVLEVRGFSKESQLLELLAKNEWVKDKPQIVQEAEDHIGWWDWLKKRSMQLSGVAMAIADTGFIVYGLKEAAMHKNTEVTHKKSFLESLSRFGEAMAGFCYLSGSTVLTMYGRNDQSENQIGQIARQILENAEAKGLATDGSAAEKICDQPAKGLLGKIDSFFRNHPSEIGNMMYFSAGALIAQSAFLNRAIAKPRADMSAKQISEMRKGGWGDTALGTATMASGLLATFGKEKAHDPDAPEKKGVSWFMDWMGRNPLAVASYGYIGSTLCHTYTTYVERKEAIRASTDMKLTSAERDFAGKKLGAVPWRMGFIGFTLLGEFLLSISSKGHGEGVVNDKSVDDSALAIAADLIIKQPKEAQGKMIEEMGAFLGRSDMLAVNDKEATDALRKQVEALASNPWAKVNRATEKSAPVITPAADLEKQIPAWQAKLAAEAAAPQLQTSV